MKIESLGIGGAWIATNIGHKDERGSFGEWFRSDVIEQQLGINFEVKQANTSTSKKNVIRGLHYSLAAIGQSKWVSCASGTIWDVVVDIRPESPTFKKWVGTELKGSDSKAIFISEGLGHGFMSLENNSVITYLLNSVYSPSEEYSINPMDPDLAINWPDGNPIIAERDLSAPLLRTQLESGKLWKN